MNETRKIVKVINICKIIIAVVALVIACKGIFKGNINATPLLLTSVLVFSAGMLQYKNKYINYVLILLDALLMTAIILYGSIQDNIFLTTGILLMFIFLTKEQKSESRWCGLLFVYSLVLEIVSIITILADYTVYSPIVSAITKSFFIDVLFIIMAVCMIFVIRNHNKRYMRIANYVLEVLFLCMTVIALILAGVTDKNYDKSFEGLLVKDTGVCKIESALDGGVISVEGREAQAGANIILDQNSSRKYQIFSYSKNANGTYTLELADTGLVLDVAGGAADWMTNIQLWTVNNEPSQNWMVIDQGNGYVSFLSECNGLALDVLAAAGIGSNIQVYGYNGEASQQFRLIPAYDGIKIAIVEEFEQIGFYDIIKYMVLMLLTIVIAFPYGTIHYKENIE